MPPSCRLLKLIPIQPTSVGLEKSAPAIRRPLRQPCLRWEKAGGSGSPRIRPKLSYSGDQFTP